MGIFNRVDKRVLLVPPAGGALVVLAPLPGGQFGDECRFHLVLIFIVMVVNMCLTCECVDSEIQFGTGSLLSFGCLCAGYSVWCVCWLTRGIGSRHRGWLGLLLRHA